MRRIVKGKIVVDTVTGYAFIYFQPKRKDETGVVKKTEQKTVNIDYDSDGKIFGVELLGGVIV